MVPLALATILALAACGGDGGGDGAAAPGSEGARSQGEVAIVDFTFRPATVNVPAGTTVTWTNEDTFAHSIQPEADLFPTSPDIGPGETFSHTYEEPGTYPYICGIHNSMTGAVVVG